MEGTIMRIDYVRIYQEEGKESITCDPRELCSSLCSITTYNIHGFSRLPHYNIYQRSSASLQQPEHYGKQEIVDLQREG